MPDRESRKKEITARRQKQILESAYKVFTEKGFTAATIHEIAGMAGVAAGTIYIYYPNKRDLFVAVIENLIVAPLKEIFAREVNNAFVPTLQSVFLDRVNMLQSDRLSGLLSLMGEIQRDPELRKMFTERLIHPFMSNMEKYYDRQKILDNPKKIDSALLVRMIGGIMIGLAIMKGLEGESSPLNRIPSEKAASQILEFVLYGLTGRPE